MTATPVFACAMYAAITFVCVSPFAVSQEHIHVCTTGTYMNMVLCHMQWDFLSKAHCLLLEAAATAALFVTFWFWVGVIALVRDGVLIHASSFMAHGGNAGVALLVVLLSRLPFVSYHFQVQHRETLVLLAWLNKTMAASDDVES